MFIAVDVLRVCHCDRGRLRESRVKLWLWIGGYWLDGEYWWEGRWIRSRVYLGR